DDLHFDNAPLTIPERPADFRPTVEENKVFGGPAVQNQPVVRLVRYPPSTIPTDSAAGKSKTCSGTFIARNWIATAAHCAAVAYYPNDPTRVDYDGWFVWDISFSDSNGRPTKTLSTLVLQFVDPLWMGPISGGTQLNPTLPMHDFALFHVDPFDNQY